MKYQLSESLTDTIEYDKMTLERQLSVDIPKSDSRQAPPMWEPSGRAQCQAIGKSNIIILLY